MENNVPKAGVAEGWNRKKSEIIGRIGCSGCNCTCAENALEEAGKWWSEALTTTVREAEEQGDGEFKELAEKAINNALIGSHGVYCPAKDQELYECQCAIYGRLSRMVEMLYASLVLPPPPDLSTDATAEEDKPTE